MQELIDQISSWIKEKVGETGKDGVVLGLSGGLDSTITAFLCKKALGSKKVLGLVMPCHLEPTVLEDAKIATEFLQIPTQYIDLSAVYDTFVSIIPEGNKTAYANLKVRLRMVTLYYFANKLDYLVVGTSNKSEYEVGYFTKYGDGAVDFMPLADIYKTELIRLAEYINVPQKIISKPPSADLWEGQTDEGELGITYKELDDILKRLVEKKKLADTPRSVAKAMERRGQKKLVEKMLQKSMHKRLFPPIFKRKE